MKRRNNLDIREKAKQAGVALWEIGDSLGYSDANFSRKLRKELPADEKSRILAVIEQLKDQAC